MAQEIQISAGVTAAKNGANVNGSFSALLDMSGTEMASLVQAHSTSSSLLDIGGCDSLKALLVKNLDSSASIDLALDDQNADKFATIPPLGAVLLCGAPTTIYARASAGTPEIFIVAVEN